jgi:hypothetical protein
MGSVSVSHEAWQEWQGWAFARVRWRSLASREALQTSGFSERARTAPNIARTCHAEGRGFESHHPLVYPARRHRLMSPRTTDDLLHAPMETSSATTYSTCSCRLVGVGALCEETVSCVGHDLESRESLVVQMIESSISWPTNAGIISSRSRALLLRARPETPARERAADHCRESLRWLALSHLRLRHR